MIIVEAIVIGLFVGLVFALAYTVIVIINAIEDLESYVDIQLHLVIQAIKNTNREVDKLKEKTSAEGK